MTPVDLDQLIGLETEVWDALVSGDPVADERLLSEDFVGVYPSGFADRDGHSGQLADGPTVTEFELHDALILRVSDTAAMVSYRANYRRTQTSDSTRQHVMYVSSLWCFRGDRWINVFSQDTPADSD